MLLPKRVKYRRVHRGRMTGKALRGNKVTYGDFGLQATEPSRLLKMYSSSSLIFLGSKLVGEESGVGTQNGEERRNLFP